jgi:hypothetical protein
MEQFISIKENPIYHVSNLGNIKTFNWRNTGREAILKPAKDKKGYLRVALVKDGKLITYKVHRLVASNFLDNFNNKPQVNHINGIKNDNRVENLEWVNNSENILHAVKLGLVKSKSGNDFHRTKHSDELILKIYSEYKAGTPKRELARKYNVDRNVFKRKIICKQLK